MALTRLRGQELADNLGTIAKSGTLEFKDNMTNEEKLNVIGQFGVGFYSAFMVSKKIVVESKSIKSETGYTWSSDGANGYSIDKNDKEESKVPKFHN